MQSNNKEFKDTIETTQVFWVVRNEPDNEITGEFRTVDEALEHAVPGNVIYEVCRTTTRKAIMVVGALIG